MNIHTVISDLRDVIGDLQKNVATVEPQFMAICERLQTLYFSTEQIQKDFTQSACLMDLESEGSVFNRVETQAQESLRRFLAMQQYIDSSIGTIGQLRGKLEELEQKGGRFRKIAYYLKVIRTNISMESVRTSRSEDLFASLADEIRELAQNIDGISGNMHDDLVLAKSRQDIAERDIRSGFGHLVDACNHAEENINDAAEKARVLVSLSHEWLSRIANHYKAISQRISDVVVAIQFHDITRQRIEHIIEGLHDVIGRLEKPAEGGKGTFGYARMSFQVQAAQLQEVIASIEDAREKAQKAFAAIGEELAVLQTDAAEALAQISGEGFAENPFEYMVQELRQFAAYIEQARELGGKTGDAVGHVTETTQSLTDYIETIREISLELSLKALNAIILTEKLGEEGHTLTVLTEEVYSLSGESQELVGVVTAELEELTVRTGSLTARNLDGEEADSDQLETCVGEINRNYEEVIRSAETTSGKVTDLQSETERVQQELDFLRELSRAFSSSRERLTVCIREIEPFVEEDEEDVSAEMEMMIRRYTMEDERAIHQRHIGGNDGEADVDPPSTADETADVSAGGTGGSEEDQDDLGDNVELF